MWKCGSSRMKILVKMHGTFLEKVEICLYSEVTNYGSVEVCFEYLSYRLWKFGNVSYQPQAHNPTPADIILQCWNSRYIETAL